MKNLYISIIYFSIGMNCSAQLLEQPAIDSLKLQLSMCRTDSCKLFMLQQIISIHDKYRPLEGLVYENQALLLANALHSAMEVANVKLSVGRLYWRAGIFDTALTHHFAAYEIYKKNNNLPKAAMALTYLGQDYADGGQYPLALEQFNKALMIFDALGDKYKIGRLHFLFAWVYTQQGDYFQSSISNRKALKIFELLDDKYCIAIAKSAIGDNLYNLGNFEDALSYYGACKEEFEKANDPINLCDTYNDLGSCMWRTGNHAEAMDYLNKALATATESEYVFGAAVSQSVIGNMYKEQGQWEQALPHYLSSIEQFAQVSNKVELASVNFSAALCYAHLKQWQQAELFFGNGYKLAAQLDSKKPMRDYYFGLEKMDSIKGNWKSAYVNYKKYQALNNDILNFETASNMTAAQMKYEEQRKDLLQKVEQDKRDARQRLVRNAIAAGLGGALLFLCIVYRQRNKIAKARQRSDELLLNILPVEVAEELKENGYAEAKQFDSVTVMFTDFKGFTQIAEKLSPTDLVAEIDYCFKSFDAIIGKYNIEKIKTIGDAYMCAAGLPLPSGTHAEDIVNAALEFQKFASNLAIKRKAANKPAFEIRVGIHTGTVIAGIVGVKKFAYDIWGDTVNIAARMESHGEVGKVNVSGPTFELIKNKFACEFRGAIDAKGKGKIDMYFVNH